MTAADAEYVEAAELAQGSGAGASPPAGSDGGSAPEASAPEAMSLAEAKALIADRHSVALGDDDPVLMLVTLHQGFLGDHARLLERHEAALTAVLSATGDTVAAAVREALAVLRDEALAGSLQNTLAAVGEQARASEKVFQRFRKATRRLVAALAVLSGLSWLAAAAAIVVLVRG